MNIKQVFKKVWCCFGDEDLVITSNNNNQASNFRQSLILENESMLPFHFYFWLGKKVNRKEQRYKYIFLNNTSILRRLLCKLTR